MFLMTHTFQTEHEISEFSLEQLTAAVTQPAFHESLVKKLPGTKVVISRSERVGDHYYMQRELNLEANIPKLAEKFLKDALRVKRIEQWDFKSMQINLTFVLNMPAEFRLKGRIVQQDQRIFFKQDWEVDVRVPLIHGPLARHAESEIRRFNQIEFDAFVSTLREFV
jgi:hypothetical protein